MAKSTKQITVGGNGAYHIVYAQAGSLEKALAEAVMNGIDAKCTRIDIDLDTEQVVVRDNGVGFDGEAEIERTFGTLMFDHDTAVERARNRKYGKFGAGRAQMFRWCKTEWRTREFRMFVDVKANGFSYDFEDGLDNIEGCQITGHFYDALLPSDVNRAIEGLTDQVRYEPTPVYVNGDLITCDPADEEWSDETDDAYFRFENSGGLRVYNMGVLVCTLPGYRYGLNGVIVSKDELLLNLSRNDIMARECKRWKRIERVLRKHSDDKVEKKKGLTVDERDAMLRRWGLGELDFSQVSKKPVLPVATGRHINPETAVNACRWQQRPFTVCPSADQNIGDTIHRRQIATVLTEGALNRLGKPISLRDPDEMVGWLEKNADRLFGRCAWQLVFVPFGVVQEGISDHHELIADKDLNKREKAILKALRQVINYPRAAMGLGCQDRRKLTVGESGTDLGWTDGVSYIALEREVIRNAGKSLDGLSTAINTLIHEVAHADEPSLAEHSHDIGFYERWEAGADRHGLMLVKASLYLVRAFERSGIKPSAKVTGGLDDLLDFAAFADPKEPEKASKPAAPRGKRGRQDAPSPQMPLPCFAN